MSVRGSFGAVDKLPSGRWRARGTGPDGKRRSSTFSTKSDARAWLATQQADAVRKTWRAPEAGKRTVGSYAKDYVAREDLRESTRVLYASLWKNHLEHHWASVPVGDVTSAKVRSWHTSAAKTVRPTALAQSYRLLRSILGVAATDEVIPSNPCKVRGAGTPKPTRPARSLTVAEVQALATKVPDRYSALILVLAFGGLRFGEATALRRSDVRDKGAKLHVERSVGYLNKRWVVGDPKTDAGRRTVALPGSVAKALGQHIDQFVADGDDALVFGTATGNYLARSNWNETFRRAVNAAGLSAVRPHELRHTGATLAAGTGATTKELMRRMGHASPAAALIYQHAADERDSEIARALDAMLAAPKARKTTTSTARRSRAVGA